jgi:hypothetical protein
MQSQNPADGILLQVGGIQWGGDEIVLNAFGDGCGRRICAVRGGVLRVEQGHLV